MSHRGEYPKEVTMMLLWPTSVQSSLPWAGSLLWKYSSYLRNRTWWTEDLKVKVCWTGFKISHVHLWFQCSKAAWLRALYRWATSSAPLQDSCRYFVSWLSILGHDGHHAPKRQIGPQQVLLSLELLDQMCSEAWLELIQSLFLLFLWELLLLN